MSLDATSFRYEAMKTKKPSSLGRAYIQTQQVINISLLINLKTAVGKSMQYDSACS